MRGDLPIEPGEMLGDGRALAEEILQPVRHGESAADGLGPRKTKNADP